MDCGKIIEEVKKHPTKYVVLTGGEPMIQKEIHYLCRELKDAGYHITIETAGTIAPEGIACNLASISPKHQNSTPQPGDIDQAWIDRHDQTRWNPDVIDQWIKNYAYQLKFVVSTPEDLAWVRGTMRTAFDYVPSEKVLLMPEGITKEELETRKKWVVDFCKKTGYRYCNRLHIDLFGNTRGT